MWTQVRQLLRKATVTRSVLVLPEFLLLPVLVGLEGPPASLAQLLPLSEPQFPFLQEAGAGLGDPKLNARALSRQRTEDMFSRTGWWDQRPVIWRTWLPWATLRKDRQMAQTRCTFPGLSEELGQRRGLASWVHHRGCAAAQDPWLNHLLSPSRNS